MAIENARLHEQLRLQAIKDGKTSLFNHDHFLELFRLEIDRTARQQNELSFLMADIDDYKLYNDTYGHLIGDRALRIIGACMRRIARSTDIPARYGGEEFAMVLPDTSTEGAISVAERIRLEVESAKFPGHDGEFDARLTLSVGFSTFPTDGIDVDSLIEFADRGLYAAKGKGKNQVARADAMYAGFARNGA
jgi:two-component system chemotaxis family response regulator WspR